MRWVTWASGFVAVCGVLASLAAPLEAAPPRAGLDLTGPGWKAWRDTEAAWRDDALVLPHDADLNALEVHPPTGGWEALEGVGTACSLPASVEEIFSDGSGVWTYHGVTWFWRDVEIPGSWSDRVVRLHVGQARQRLEVYVDGRLAGYDIVAETPVTVDLSPFLRPGATQRLAFRITNPGGQRGWEDAPVVEWGSARLIPGHDFGGVAGRVALEATASTFVEDVFVASLPPSEERRLEIQVTFDNTRAEAREVTVAVEIRPWPRGETLHRHVWDETLPARETFAAKWVLAVPGAELWDLDTPRLHVAEVTVSDGSGVLDRMRARFGFRVFEVKAGNLFLNGRRVRLRSAIDWGYYALTGFYATPEMARRSVEAARAVGHNAISFHRRIGDPLVMEAADEAGLLLYEEPGGFTETLREMTAGPPDWAKRESFEGRLMLEKIRRMVRRDRNHPSLVAYNLMNERSTWGRLQKRAFATIAALDGTRLVMNQSGGQGGGSSGPIPHLRPFEKTPRLDFVDDHTVGSQSRFQESDLRSHQDLPTSELWTEERGTTAADPARSIVYWGEVRCYTGPDSWVELAAMRDGRPVNHPGYDWRSFQRQADAVEAYVSRNRLVSTGRFRTAADLTRQAARGLMYIDGRLGQTILTGNHNDGYAINGWSGTHLDLGDDPQAWYSAIVDEGRHLKGPAGDMAYWTRGLQVAIRRLNGKSFRPGETARFDVHLINEGRLRAGEYRLRLGVLDGDGEPTSFGLEKTIAVEGGDVHAQRLIEDLEVTLGEDWKAGHVTVTAELRGGGAVVADGAEQVLLANRSSWGPALAGLRGAAFGWAGAATALEEAGAEVVSFADPGGRLDYVAAGDVPTRGDLEELLARVERDGTRLVVRFDAAWALALLEAGLLAEPVTTWGGAQLGHWKGDGWGYLDFLVGERAVPSGATIGTNSWEVPGDPVGFAPFEASVPQTSYGAHLSRTGTILTLVGALDHGAGTILLLPSYPVDDRHPLNDLLFFHALTKGVRS